jgi:hypothetical protein
VDECDRQRHITSPVTRERLRDGSFTVLLDVSVQTAWRRIGRRRDRPLARGARVRRPVRAATASHHAAAGALVDAEQLEGGEPLLVPLSRPAALAELPRLVGARRAALIADRAVLRLVGAPVEPLVTVRLPVGEAAKTVAVARQAWTRLADLGWSGGRGGGPGRRRRHRRNRVRGRHLPARRAVDRGADLASGDGGRGHRQDRDPFCPAPELRRRLSARPSGGDRPGLLECCRRCWRLRR